MPPIRVIVAHFKRQRNTLIASLLVNPVLLADRVNERLVSILLVIRNVGKVNIHPAAIEKITVSFI